KLAKKFKNARFFGKVSESDKIRLLSLSWLQVNPSVREGWGINVIEGNACGTPCIAFAVPGLRDSIKHNQTGILVKEDGNIQKLAEAIMMVLKDKKLRQKLSKNALEYSKQFNWDKSADEFLNILGSI
ncbi:MAG: glycosyltransferase family 4 protein, partial [Candidatus Woesearchaeota archaeon]